MMVIGRDWHFGRCVWLEESGEEDVTAHEVRVYLAGKTWLWIHSVVAKRLRHAEHWENDLS